MQNQEMFNLFTKLAKEAGFDKVYDSWYFEGSNTSDGWSSDSRIIDGVPVKFFMWKDESVNSNKFKPSLIVDVDEIMGMYPDKIDWGEDDKIDANDFGADVARFVNYNFYNSIKDLSAIDIIEMIPDVVRNAKRIYNEYELV